MTQIGTFCAWRRFRQAAGSMLCFEHLPDLLAGFPFGRIFEPLSGVSRPQPFGIRRSR